ncbi:adenylyltransferase/sulfurtransferase MoeZ [Lentzea sp. NBRC 105346]|uniref:ThiF family adenylyltransferase n=1 Tax=Lentzea sp. NBRC 105346 TaxID=3032205 RepID=UPI0024A4E2E8|nr:ThiF family adenylyltransferase [Lentzea sp. NBRC 105346]GLZ29318.1 adenylyltransferase/sulfurtransferase MoeZ [Lentzea sp. NBRC 105346]
MPFPPLVSPADDLGDDYVRAHAHQLILVEVGAAGQRRLRAGSVLVVGADEIGAPALTHLADAGVGRLGIVDGSPLHPWDQYAGLPGYTGTRAAAWTSTLQGVHPSLTITAYESRLSADNALELISDYDVVLYAGEDPAMCCLVDDACARLGKPFVWAGMEAAQGRVSVFWEQHGPTFRDLQPMPSPYFRGMAGALKALGGWLSAVMATETIKLLTGTGEPLVGRLMTYDAMSAHTSVVPLDRTPHVRPGKLTAAEPFFGLLSPAAADAARESTISAEELKVMLDNEVPLLLVDVREADEHAFADLPGSVLMPKKEFLEGDAALSLPQDRKVVLFCRMGIRSAEALAVVKKHGHPDAVHLGGGILAWADRVDPSLPRY